jgi:hypothetical protein
VMKASSIFLFAAGMTAGAYLVCLRTAQQGSIVSTVPTTEVTQSIGEPMLRPAFWRFSPLSEPEVATFVQHPNIQPRKTAAPHFTNGNSLARELQTELKRVGCYDGHVDGVWGLSSRIAAKAFAQRVNAKLPFDAPDPILLTLVSNYQDEVCGKLCPAREGLRQDGRCQPTASRIQADAITTPADIPAAAATSWTTTTVVAPTPVGPASEGHMALNGPAAEESPSPTAVGPTPTKPATSSSPSISQGAWVRSILRSNMSAY